MNCLIFDVMKFTDSINLCPKSCLSKQYDFTKKKTLQSKNGTLYMICTFGITIKLYTIFFNITIIVRNNFLVICFPLCHSSNVKSLWWDLNLNAPLSAASKKKKPNTRIKITHYNGFADFGVFVYSFGWFVDLSMRQRQRRLGSLCWFNMIFNGYTLNFRVYVCVYDSILFCVHNLNRQFFFLQIYYLISIRTELVCGSGFGCDSNEK